MITTKDLAKKLTEVNGESVKRNLGRIREAAEALELMGDGLPYSWYDDDADEIALHIFHL